MDITRKQFTEILNQSIDSLGRYARNKMAWICIGGESGSGVWITIGSHYFIATAAHVLKKKGDIYIAPPAPCIEKEPHKILPLRFGKNETFDVAYVEVDKSCVSELQIDPIELENLSTQPIHSNNTAFVAGFPSQLYEISDVKIGKNLEIYAVFLSGIFVFPTGNPPELNDVKYPTDANLNDDVIIRWLPNDCLWTGFDWVDGSHSEVRDLGLTNPGGISGGGIWSLNLELKQKIVWSPHKQPKLVGIQHHYNPKKHYLRGTKIHHWLSLISADYRDIRNEIVPMLNSGKI